MRSILLIVCLTLSLSLVGVTASAEVPSSNARAASVWVVDLSEAFFGFVKGWFVGEPDSATESASGGTTEGGPGYEPDGLLGGSNSDAGPALEPDGLIAGPTLEPDGLLGGSTSDAGPALEPDGR